MSYRLSARLKLRSTLAVIFPIDFGKDERSRTSFVQQASIYRKIRKRHGQGLTNPNFSRLQRRKRTRKAVVSSSKKKSGYPKECIMFAEKTDSESSCLLFEKRKAVTRKNALCLRRKRTRKAVVPFSKKEKRLSERMRIVAGLIMIFDCNKYALRFLF